MKVGCVTYKCIIFIIYIWNLPFFSGITATRRRDTSPALNISGPVGTAVNTNDDKRLNPVGPKFGT